MVVRQSAAEISAEEITAEEGEDVSLFRQKPLALFFLLQNTRRYWLVKKGQKKKKEVIGRRCNVVEWVQEYQVSWTSPGDEL